MAMKSGAIGGGLSRMATMEGKGVFGSMAAAGARKFGTVGLQSLKRTNEYDFGTKNNRGEFKKATGFNMKNPLTMGLTNMGADSEKGYKGVVEARVKAAKEEAKLITGKDTAETLERQKSYANTEAKSIMNAAFLGFDKRAQAEVKKGVIEQAVKDNKDSIENEYKEASNESEGIKDPVTEKVVKVEEIKKELTTEQKTRIETIDKEIVNQEARKGTIDPATGNFTDVTKVVDALKKEKEGISSTQTVQNDIKDAEKALENGTLQMDKQLSQNLETLSATIGTAFTEKITGPLSEQLKTINKNLETATGDKKEVLVKEKAEKEKEIEKRDKDFKDAKSILANIPESSAGAIMKQAVSDPRIMISLGARVRKNNLSEWSKKKADADKKRKEKLEDSQIKAGEELDNDKSDKKPAEEKPKKEPKPEGGGEEGAH
jgi:hypothetical protein